MRRRHILFWIVSIVGLLFPLVSLASTAPGTIDSSNRISWLCTAETNNTDCHDHTLVNWKVDPALSSADPVIVTDTNLYGWIFSTQLGWIHLAPTDPTSTVGWGVTNLGAGTLVGYAWGISGSWVNFNPTNATSATSVNHGVQIDPTTGEFSGWAWVQNYGWMLFDCSRSDGTTSACVKTTWRPSTDTTGGAVSDPVSNLPTGTYTGTQSVTLSSTNSTSITYTTDGTTPSCTTGTTYTGPISVASSETIKAIGCGTGTTTPSAVVSFDYTIHIPAPPGAPTSDHDTAVTYSAPFSAVLASASSTSIFYTNDGTVPTCTSGTQYSIPINISSAETITAVGCNADGASSVSTFNYTFAVQTPATISAPQASLPSGTYNSTQSVTLYSTNSTSIHYTNDGTPPTCSSGTIYNSGGIDIISTETIQAIGCASGISPSPVSSYTYTISLLGGGIGTVTASTTATTTVTGIDIVSVIPNQISSVSSTSPVVNAVVDVANTGLKTVRSTAIATQHIFTAPQNTTAIGAVTTTGVAVSIAVPVVSGIVLSSFSLADIILSLIRLWSLLLGALGLVKRKKPWGTVYDAITKQPLDPAYVVLKSVEGVDVATAITDLDGRYGFVVPEPGNYSLFVHKTNYMFPSQKLVGQDHDELYRDLYFGEHFAITKSGDFVAKNIPMDPEKFDWNEFAKKSQHLMRFYSVREKWFSRISSVFFFGGFAVSSAAVLFSMTKFNIVIFLLYVVMFFVRIFGLKSHPFGSIMSKGTGKPVPFAIIRITQASTGVEVMHRVADSIGRYYCLLPNGQYLVRIDQKLADQSYKKIVEGVAVTVSKGYMSERFVVDSLPIDGTYVSTGSSLELGK